MDLILVKPMMAKGFMECKKTCVNFLGLIFFMISEGYHKKKKHKNCEVFPSFSPSQKGWPTILVWVKLLYHLTNKI